MKSPASLIEYSGTDHWFELTVDATATGQERRVIMDTGAKFVDVTVGPDGELIEVHAEGMEVRATPRYNREEISKMLDVHFNGFLSADQITAILDWYEDLVSVLIEMEIYDYDEGETCMYDGTCFTVGMEWDSLQDEVADVIESNDARIVPALAVQVNDWWRTGGFDEADIPEGDIGMVADISLV
jgi:hypothetical protein